MHYIRNWPEGLFILFVCAGPLIGIASGSGHVVWLLLIPVGIVLWLVVIWAAVRLDSRKPNPPDYVRRERRDDACP